MYDKQSRKERGYASDADSDGVVGFGKPRAAKSIMTEEQVCSLLLVVMSGFMCSKIISYPVYSLILAKHSTFCILIHDLAQVLLSVKQATFLQQCAPLWHLMLMSGLYSHKPFGAKQLPRPCSITLSSIKAQAVKIRQL